MKFFFFDIDGTLIVGELGDQYVPESALETIRALKKKGHFLSLATGRSHAMARQWMEPLGIYNMVSDGGNGIVLDGEVIEITPLDRKLCIELIDECRKLGFPWGLSDSDSEIRLVPDGSFDRATDDIYQKSRIVPNLDPKNCSEIYKVYVACSEKEEKRIEMLKKLTYVRYNDRYLFVEPTRKADGIRKMLEIVGGKPEDVVVFGDSKNDISMACPEWLSICMAGAPEELKRVSDYITDTAENDGIKKAAMHFNWI